MSINAGDRVRVTNPAFHGVHGLVQDVQGHASCTGIRFDVVVILDGGPVVKIGMDDIEHERPSRATDRAIAITGIWLQKATAHNGNALIVLAEVDGVWRTVITEVADDGPISHIVEPAGIEQAPKWGG